MNHLAKKWLSNQRMDVRNRLEKIFCHKKVGKAFYLNEASKLFAEFGTIVCKFEKDLGNMRKARGGSTFEKAVMKLLNVLRIQNEKPRGRRKAELARIDIVIPTMDTALETPDRVIFLACKRTFAERWKQEIPPGARINWRIYLLTIDQKITESKANEIHERSLVAFIRNELKQNDSLRNMAWMRSLNDLPGELERR